MWIWKYIASFIYKIYIYPQVLHNGFIYSIREVFFSKHIRIAASEKYIYIYPPLFVNVSSQVERMKWKKFCIDKEMQKNIAWEAKQLIFIREKNADWQCFIMPLPSYLLFLLCSMNNFPFKTHLVVSVANNNGRSNKAKSEEQKRNARYERLCKELVKFTPNLCDNKDAKIKCSVCKKLAEAAGLPFSPCFL